MHYRILGILSWVSVVLIFSLSLFSANANAKSREQVIYAFSGYPDCGDLPTAKLIADDVGNLYGTTLDGGANKKGCIFELSRDATNNWREAILHSFGGPDGDGPAGALVFDQLGNLYGTTLIGGAYNGGVVFELSPSGNGGWTESVLYNFGGSNDGLAPNCDLVFDKDGNLYGTTTSGGNRKGNFRAGTAFKLSPSQNGWIETILHSFYGLGLNASDPVGGLVMDSEGNIYGAAKFGGTYGAGAVYELRLKNGVYKEHVIHSFNTYDGWEPSSGLVMDSSGNLYGTTYLGGAVSSNCPAGCGAVFKLAKGAHDTWTESVVVGLNGNDGYLAVGPVAIDSDGNLYAAAMSGGMNANGSVYKLTPTKSGWRENVLHLFDFRFPNGVDGAQPYAGVMVHAGQLFGTTAGGGVHNEGTVFRIKLLPDSQ
jgi:uncharacterized repeat protein (TIGR03803 family)